MPRKECGAIYCCRPFVGHTGSLGGKRRCGGVYGHGRSLAVAIAGDRSLLIVEDDKSFLQRLARAMESRGFAVTTAETVADGLTHLEIASPAFAVVDMRLGDGNGLDVVSALKRRRPDARAIVLTGYGNIATAVNAVKLGAVDYLVKPADADDVIAALLALDGNKADPPENPMSADRVRWEHIQRIYELCQPQRLGDRTTAQHASANAAAHPRQARAEVSGGPLTRCCEGVRLS